VVPRQPWDLAGGVHIVLRAVGGGERAGDGLSGRWRRGELGAPTAASIGRRRRVRMVHGRQRLASSIRQRVELEGGGGI
jgi:hypothetical protein